MIKVKIFKSNQMSVETDKENRTFHEVYNMTTKKRGKEVELSEKDFNYINQTEKRLIKVQEILKKAYES